METNSRFSLPRFLASSLPRSIPILLYHHIAPDREITPEGFEAQLRYLLEQGYSSLSMDELVAYVRGESSLKEPAFAVTFDDGYFDNWGCAFPVLEKLKVKATYYLVTERMEDHAALRSISKTLDTRTQERQPGGFLSWSEAKAMAHSGLVTFGSHTHTHRGFVRRDPYANLEQELSQSKALIESRLGRPCPHLAWPWGDYETSWLPLIKKLGYQSAVTTLAGANGPGTNPLELKRLSVRRPTVQWLEERLRWNKTAFMANTYGAFYGWDRRFKVWWNKESPYSHG